MYGECFVIFTFCYYCFVGENNFVFKVFRHSVGSLEFFQFPQGTYGRKRFLTFIRDGFWRLN